MENNIKIFGIGLSKTGTSSLNEALNILNYKACHFPSIRYIPHTLVRIKRKYLREFNALTDISVIPFYKKLDKQYPGSKFIYTCRDKSSWLESCRKYPRYQLPLHQVPFKIIKLRQEIYGTVKFDEQKFSEAYDRHEQDVKQYFKNREQDLLILDITKENSWEKLCNFLQKPIPDQKFPMKNASQNNYDNTQIKYQKRIS